MAATDILMPKLGLTMTEGVLLEWTVDVGAPIAKGQTIFLVETNKVVTEVEAAHDGVLTAQLVPSGEAVAIGTPVGRVAPAGAKNETAIIPSSTPMAAWDPPASDVGGAARRIVATPLARRLASERGVDLATVAGTGPRGRIKAIDVETNASAAEGLAAPPAMPSTHRVEPSNTQLSMARLMAESKHGVPHFYVATEVDVGELLSLRASLNAGAAPVRVTVNHFLVAAVARALRAYPDMNRIWRDDGILRYESCDVGIVVDTDAGPFVPLLRDAGAKSIDQIAAASNDIVTRARARRLAADDMSGGAISISNVGMFGVGWLTPIINPGHSSILGVGAVRDVFRPGADGAPVLRRELGLVLAGDHRIHTGAAGAKFIRGIKDQLENPIQFLRHF